MSAIFEVRGEARADGRVCGFGARMTQAEGEALLAETRRRYAGVTGWTRFWLESVDTTGAFELPSRPAPRERFTVSVEETRAPGRWTTSEVTVHDGDLVVGRYHRDYAMLDTFEPFRQGDRLFALVSTHYTATAVMDLATGEVVAREEPSAEGFCPVGFYVPDWWDVNSGSTLPGELRWTPDHEWPSRGDFGFVWGCVWGDDSSWKVQYLDLTDVASGTLRRDERFGYLKLASRPGAPPTDFIRCRSRDGRRTVELVVEEEFDLATGERSDLDPWE